MLQKIKQQINNIDQALAWIRQHKPDHYGQRFFQLVSERCKLRNMAEAETLPLPPTARVKRESRM